MIARQHLICRQTCKNRKICDLPVTELAETGLIVMNRHWSEKHINQIPYDWLIEQMLKMPEVAAKIKLALDKNV